MAEMLLFGQGHKGRYEDFRRDVFRFLPIRDPAGDGGVCVGKIPLMLRLRRPNKLLFGLCGKLPRLCASQLSIASPPWAIVSNILSWSALLLFCIGSGISSHWG